MYTPQFKITNTILTNIGIIEAAREVINRAPLLPYYEKKFQEDALVRTVHYGTHIEGNELDLTQAEKVVQGQTIIARERDIQEVINYRKVMEYLDEIDTSSKPLDESLIKHMHTLVVEHVIPEETAGIYRRPSVVIRNSHTGEIVFRPPQAVIVPFQIADLLEYLNITKPEDLHPVLKAGIAHYEFVRIHPFVEGNGRLARALSTLILFREGYDIRKFFSLEEFFDKDLPAYYGALQSVEKNNSDLTEWLEYFTKALAVELTRIKEKVEKISADGKIKQKLGGKPFLMSERQMKIVEFIQENGYLENKAFKSLFPMISEDSILLDLKSLINAGVIRKQGVTKGVKYVMNS